MPKKTSKSAPAKSNPNRNKIVIAALAGAVVLGGVYFAVSSYLKTPTVILPNPTIQEMDLDLLLGGTWTGTLTYLDYSSNQTTTIPTNLSVSKPPTDPRAWNVSITYPKEPQANSLAKWTIAQDGTTLDIKGDTQTVISREFVTPTEANQDGSITKVTTESKGTDNDKPATIRHIYYFSAREFIMQKLVTYDDASTNASKPPTFIERNTYRWTRP